MKIALPFLEPSKYPLTQKFGVKFMYQGKLATHKGVDYAMPKLTPLKAPFDGKIIRITPERNYGYGKAIYIEATDDQKGTVIALLAHLSSIDVELGMKVKRGNIVGFSGRSGFWRGVNGYHLHFGIKVNGYYIDPLEFMKMNSEQEISLFNYEDDALKTFLGQYIVKHGDTLWSISEKYYGNGGHYMEIFLVNEDVLKNPNLIHPGDVLRIPALKNKGI